MNFKLLFLSATTSLVLSCNNQSQESTENVTPSMLSYSTCYSYTNNKDTVLLKTTSVKDTVTGTLSYNYYQKDKNNGKIEGQMKGDLLIVDYLFLSEGVQSIRQIAFKKIGNTLIEGYGEVEDKNGKTIFKNTDSLIFNQTIILSEVECEKQIP